MLPFASSICTLGALACGPFALQSSPTVSSPPDAVSSSRIYTSAVLSSCLAASLLTHLDFVLPSRICILAGC
ncbi:hypothetical protein BDR03DRAFT_966863 [Suillus americanus]|nr:hypothetical protein BDR03DRAFT_966863 [Suillus americanus]